MKTIRNGQQCWRYVVGSSRFCVGSQWRNGGLKLLPAWRVLAPCGALKLGGQFGRWQHAPRVCGPATQSTLEPLSSVQVG
jgi:hypothetical protein